MTRWRAWALLLATVPLVGSSLSAQSTQPSANISGRATDAGGRPITRERVELVFEGTIIDTTATGRRGEWTFENVRSGDYLVRIRESCLLVGKRVTVTPGQKLANIEIVVPSAAQCCCCCGAVAPVAPVTAASPPWLIPLATVVTAVAGTAIVVTAS